MSIQIRYRGALERRPSRRAATAAVDAVFTKARPITPSAPARPASAGSRPWALPVQSDCRHARSARRYFAGACVRFDVHHGNGTQEIFWSDPNFFYGSTHQMPLYPGSGAANETGVGNIFNAPLRAGDGSVQFRDAMRSIILPALDDFAPDLVLISAGFDAHAADPLAQPAR
jgi:hypothetical protein